jgi:hypothetical protein
MEACTYQQQRFPLRILIWEIRELLIRDEAMLLRIAKPTLEPYLSVDLIKGRMTVFVLAARAKMSFGVTSPEVASRGENRS